MVPGRIPRWRLSEMERRDFVDVARMRAAPAYADECKRVWAAVIQRAIEDTRESFPCGMSATSGAGTIQRVHREARQWFESEDDEPGSFVWCCHLLDLDPRALLQGIRRRAAA